VDRFSTVVFNKNRKGGELLDSSGNQEQLRLEEETPTQAEEPSRNDNDEDTIVVQTRLSEPHEDSDEDTIVV
jgi:hypothetical protein